MCTYLNTIFILRHNKNRIKELSDYVYICRYLYLHSIDKFGLQSKKEKKHKYNNNYTKIQDRQLRSQMFCFCTKYYSCTNGQRK